MRRAARRALAAILALSPPAVFAAARDGRPQEGRPQTWLEVKCARYAAAWTEALARRGRLGLGRDFLDRHAAFLASGCSAPSDVCPRSPEELDLANIMVVAAMNGGAASTFPPFACRR